MNQVKKCTSCGDIKSFDLFENQKDSIDGKRHQCRECRYQQKKLRNKTYEVDLSIKEKLCLTCEKVLSVIEFHKNKRVPTGLSKVCVTCIAAKGSEYYEKNKASIKKEASDYYYANKEVIQKKANKRQKERERTDPKYKLSRRLRNRLYYALRNKGWKKTTKLNDYIGCDYETLVQHLQAQFKPDMTWENHGELWHIDHIKALSLAETEEEMYKLCHYTNLQPLYGPDNIKKGNKRV